MNNLKFAFRQLLKNPAFTAVAVLTLALGIGANTAIFSIVNGVLLKPLAYHEPERLVRVFNTFKEQDWDRVNITAPAFVEWREQNTVFEDMAAIHGAIFNLTGRGEPERLVGQSASSSLFPLLGVTPALGRHFTAEEEQFGKHRVVMLSHRFWQRHFNADPKAVGQALTLNGESWEIVGVLPAGFHYQSTDIELWTPLAFSPETLRDGHGSHSYNCVARLKPGITLAKANAEMNTIHARLAEQHGAHRGWSGNVEEMQEVIVGDSRRALLVLLGAVGFVLLIACANVANLLLARTASRAKEFAIRSALGAGRRRVIGQVLTESIALALIGGLLGWIIAFWSVQVFVTTAPTDSPRVDEISLDARVFGFGLLVSLATGMIFGLAPALAAARADLNETLKDTGRGTTEGFRRHRLRSALVVAEVALSLVLLVGAGLLIRSFLRLREVDPGFQPARLIVATITLSSRNYTNEAAKGAFFERVRERLQTLPGVQSAALAFGLPLQLENANISVRIEGRPEPKPNEPGSARYVQITPGYFRTMGTPLLRGRDIDRRDTTNAPLVAVVNERFERTFFPNEDALGKRLNIGDGPERWTEIVGVVRDMRHESFALRADPAMYLPMSQRCWGHAQIVVQTAVEPTSMASAVRKTILELDPEQPIHQIRTMERMVNDALAGRRVQTLLLGVFGAVALALAAVGIYGVMAYSVTRRSHEIGVRMALGAQIRDVLRLVIGQGMRLALIGVAIGTMAALGLTRVMSKLLYEVAPTDPLTFGGVALLLTGISLLACYLPARRAAKVDPMQALRTE